MPEGKKIIVEDDLPKKSKKIIVEDEDDIPKKKKVIIEDDIPKKKKVIIEDDIPKKKKVIIEEEDDIPPPKKKVIIEEEDDIPPPKKIIIEDDIPKKKKVIIEDDQVNETDPGESLPLPPRVPLAYYKPEQSLYFIKGTNVVFSYPLAMVVGFVYQSAFIQAPMKEVREVCERYKLCYIGDVLRELEITREK